MSQAFTLVVALLFCYWAQRNAAQVHKIQHFPRAIANRRTENAATVSKYVLLWWRRMETLFLLFPATTSNGQPYCSLATMHQKFWLRLRASPRSSIWNTMTIWRHRHVFVKWQTNERLIRQTQDNANNPMASAIITIIGYQPALCIAPMRYTNRANEKGLQKNICMLESL